MKYLFRLGCVPFLVLLGCGGRGVVQRAAAQAPSAEESDERLGASELKYEDRERILKLREGREPLTGADLPLLEKAAKWYVYRVTWANYQKREPPENRSVYDILNSDLYPQLIIPDPRRPGFTPNDNQLQYQRAFTKKLIKPLQDVLKNPKDIARINAGLILARLSETGSEDLAVPCAEILEDPNQKDAVKFFALVALKNVFKGDPFVPDAPAVVDPAVRARVVKALENFLLNRKASFTAVPSMDFGGGREGPPGGGAERAEGGERRPAFGPPGGGAAGESGAAAEFKKMREQLAAFHYLRREAIRALCQTQYPALSKGRVGGQLQFDARTAFDLFRIVAQDNINPRATLEEQVEAVVGICHLKHLYFRDYQLDYAMDLLGQFFVRFGEDYERARLNKEARAQTPWKSYSAMIGTALTALAVDVQTDSKASTFVRLSQPMFKSILAGGQAEGLRELRNWLQTNPPAQPMLYRGDQNSTIETGGDSGPNG